MKRSSMLIIRFQNKVCTQLYALLNFRRAQCPYFICSVTVTVNKKKLNFRNIANLEGGTKKISESSTGIEPMTSRTHGGHSRGHGFDSCQGLTQIFSLSHAHVMLNNSSFTFHYRAQHSPSSLTYHFKSHLSKEDN